MATFYWNPLAAGHAWGDSVWTNGSCSGSTPGTAGPPGAGDNAYFSSVDNSGCSLPSDQPCAALDFTQGTGWAGAFTGNGHLITAAGNVAFNSVMTFPSAMALTMSGGTGGTTTTTLITAGQQFLGLAISNAGSGIHTVSLQDTSDFSGNNNGVSIAANAKLLTNGNTVTTKAFTGSSGGYADLTNSTININGTSNTLTLLNMSGTFNAPTVTGSIINFVTGAAGSSFSVNFSAFTYATVNITGAGLYTISGGPTIGTFSYTSTTNKTDQLILGGNLTVTGVCTIAGNSSVNRAFVLSSVLGTQRTITGGIMVVSNADFQDVNVSGENQCLQSQAFTTSPWAKQGTTTTASQTAPDGTSTAIRFTEDSSTGLHRFYLVSQTYTTAVTTFSMFVKYGSCQWVGLLTYPNYVCANFDLINGVVGYLYAASGSAPTASITAVGGGWWRITMTAPSASYVQYQFYLSNSNYNGNLAANSFTGDGTSYVTCWGAQVEAAATARTYMPTTSAAVTALDLSAITGLSGDCLGNSGITFTTPATQTFAKTAAGSYNWSDATCWTSRVPLPQDNVAVNYSGANAITLTADMPRMGRNVSFAGFTKQLNGSIVNTVFGNFTVSASMGFGSNEIDLGGRGAQTITSNGNGFPAALKIAAPAGTYTMQDALTVSSGSLSFSAGTLNNNGFSVTVNNFGGCAAGGTATYTGSGVLNLNRSASSGNIFTSTRMTTDSTMVVNITSGPTAGGSYTFIGNGLTYGALNWSSTASTGTLIITGANTFADIQTSPLTARTIQFPASTTQTLSAFSAKGSSGHILSLTSSTPGTKATLSKASGLVSSDYLSLTDSAATGGAAWFAGVHSTETTTTGWILSSPGGLSRIGARWH